MEKAIRVKKKRLGSFPFVSVVFSITMALFVVGVFGVLILHGATLTKLIKENLEINIFLKKEASDNERTKVNRTLLSKDYIFSLNGQPQIHFVSKEEAAKKFIEDTGEDFLKFLGENPLRDAYIIKVKPELYNKPQLDIITTDIEKIEGVHEVAYQENLISSINENLAKISLILVGLSALLLVIVVILINSTIKLALFSQRMLIRSMQLVGAKASFIQWPFLFRSLLHGLLSGLISSGLIILLLQFSYERIEGLKLLLDVNKLFVFFAFIIAMGIVISVTSTYYSMNKYLKMSLDELY